MTRRGQDLHVAGEHHAARRSLAERLEQRPSWSAPGLLGDGQVVEVDPEAADQLGVVAMVGGHEHGPCRELMGVPAAQQVDQAVGLAGDEHGHPAVLVGVAHGPFHFQGLGHLGQGLAKVPRATA